MARTLLNRNASAALFALSCGLLAGTLDADAQAPDQQWTYCDNKAGDYAADLQIGGCTGVIQSGRETPVNLAIAFANRGRTYHAKGDYARAIADYDQAIKLNPKAANALMNRGSAYADQGNYSRAIADFDQAIRLNPQNGYAFYNRGNTYKAQGDSARAIVDFDQAIRLNPQFASAFANRGRTYHAKGDYARAIADYDQTIKLNPKAANAFYDRGSAYQSQGLYFRAIVDYDQAGLIDANNAGYQNARCWNRALVNRELEVARAACDAALLLEPQDPDILDSRGLVGLKQGRFSDAWNDYDAAARLNANNASYLFGRGVAALRLGRTQAGQADIARATQIDVTIAQAYADYGITP